MRPADAGEAVVLATRLTVPVVRSQLIDRANLVDELTAEPMRKLSLVSAPAGWGKTTLLAQWVRGASANHRLGWLTLDASDNDPIRFWTCTLTAVEKAHPGTGSRALELLASGADPTKVVIPVLLNDLAASTEQVVLVLDDYHLVENPIVHQQVAFAITRMPATLRLVVSTRSDPPLPLARLRADGELLEIRTDNLRFLDDEASRLLTEVLGLELAGAQVQLLYHRTEGWAAGLYLAGLSLAGRTDADAFIRAFAGDNRHIADYLITEVLDRQLPHIRDFLLRTSLLGRLSGALCDAVLQTTGSAAVLETIERDNLFLRSLDDSRHWYRYHQLFAELLRAHLNYLEPGLVPDLHQRAAAWFAADGLVDDAMHHLTAVGQTAQRAELIATHWVTEFNRGRLSTIAGWLDAMPRNAVTSDPHLSTARGWIAMDQGQVDAAGAWIDTTEIALAAHPEQAEAVRPRFAVLRALFQFKTGHLEAAAHTASGAIASGLPDEVMGRAGAHSIYGAAQYFLGNSGEAVAALRKTTPLAELAGDHRVRSYALGILAIIAAEQGRVPDAQQLIEQAKTGGGAFASGERLVGAVVSLIAAAIVLDRQGDCAAASEAADVAVAAAREGAGVHETAKALLVQAQTRERCGDHLAAASSRREAAATLSDDADPLLVERPPLIPHDSNSAEDPSSTTPDEQLTERELEVLQLLATKLSRRQIADQLFISLNTVKTHQRFLYRKLGVDDRNAAVLRARQLGLL